MRNVVLFAAIVVAPVAILWPFLAIPFMNDEGIYATIAREMMHGGLPYHDLFDVTPPATYLWYIAGFTLFGEEVWAPRLMLAISLSATVALIAFEARLLLGSREAALRAGFCMAAATALCMVSVFAVDEYFVLLPLTASYVALTLALRRKSTPWLAAMGLLAGLSIITNQSSAVHFLFQLWLVKRYSSWSWRTSVLVPSAAMTTVFGLVALPYLANGSFGDLWYGAVKYPLMYAEGSTVGERAGRSLYQAMWFSVVGGPLVVLACIGLWATIAKRGSLEKQVLIAWACATLIAISLNGRLHTYYLVGLYPILGLLAGSGITEVLTWRWRRPIMALPALLIIFAYLASVGMNLGMYTQPTGEGKLMAWASAENQIREAQSRRVASLLTTLTTPRDTIYNLGRQGEIYFYANREPASRFLHEWPLLTDPNNLSEVLDDFAEKAPAVIIDTQWPEYLEGLTEEYPWALSEFISGNYDHIARIYFDGDILVAFDGASSRSDRNDLTFYGDVYVFRGDRGLTATTTP
jgi:4-amino-4-deoxy-L-arabinose transferase-like glycosyltransferase